MRKNLLVALLLATSVAAATDHQDQQKAAWLKQATHYHGQIPKHFRVAWNIDNIMPTEGHSPGAVGETKIRRIRWADLNGQRYSQREDEIGLGYHWERGLVDDGEQAFALDHLAETARPVASDSRNQIHNLAQFLPPLLVHLLRHHLDDWQFNNQGEIEYQAGPNQNWQIETDSKTGRIQAVRSGYDDYQGQRIPTRITFEDDQHFHAGICVPRRSTLYEGETIVQRQQLVGISRSNFSAASFQPIPGYQHIPARPDDAFEFRAKSLGPGMHWIGSGVFYQLFVELEDGIVAMDATGGDVQARLDAIRQRVPDKPLKWVLVSHHHGDHLHGLVEYVKAGAFIIASPAHQPAIEETLQARDIVPHYIPTVWVEDETDMASVEFSFDRGAIKFDQGEGRRIIFKSIETRHSEQLVIAILPDDQIAYSADLWVNHHRAPEIATPNAMTLYRVLKESGHTINQIVDAHSAIVLQFEDLEAAVNNAINNGYLEKREFTSLVEIPD